MPLTYEDLKRMLGGAVDIIRLKNDELSLLDAAIGDGDHGVTMLRAFEKVNQVMGAHQQPKIDVLLSDIGWALLDIDGGATGPLYGSLFLGMSEGTAGLESLEPNQFALMFEGGLASIGKQTKARLGDKTLMDALIPAVESLRKSADLGQDIPEMLAKAAAAAMQGAETTKNFPAHFGRAKYQGDRTIGHPDPGAISLSYVLQGMQDGLAKA